MGSIKFQIANSKMQSANFSTHPFRDSSIFHFALFNLHFPITSFVLQTAVGS